MRCDDGKVRVTKKDKIIKKVLHRLLNEESTKLIRVCGKISILNHQTENYESMYETIQDNVRNDMFNLMHENGWHDYMKQIKEELDALSELNETEKKE